MIRYDGCATILIGGSVAVFVKQAQQKDGLALKKTLLLGVLLPLPPGYRNCCLGARLLIAGSSGINW